MCRAVARNKKKGGGFGMGEDIYLHEDIYQHNSFCVSLQITTSSKLNASKGPFNRNERSLVGTL